MTAFVGQSLGGYLLEEEIGRGSMGIVYRGKQLALGREVSVKILPPSLAHDPVFAARFIREAQIIAQLNHPHIVQIYDAGQHDDVLYFAMEYVPGPTIKSLLALDGAIPQHLAAAYIAHVADALDAAYTECQVIHRDLKPENLMLDRWGKLKVMDFGLARAPGLPQITTAQTLVGSLFYASPEQIRGQPLDNRSDIYALGVVLYEMVTGSRPFAGKTLQEVAQAIIAGSVFPPTMYLPEVSRELEQIVLTAMAPNRNERFAQASLMAKALRALDLRAPSVGSMSHAPEKSPAASSEPFLQTQRLTLPMREPSTPLPDVLAQNNA
jgi:serine/threonine-protein kinase